MTPQQASIERHKPRPRKKKERRQPTLDQAYYTTQDVGVLIGWSTGHLLKAIKDPEFPLQPTHKLGRRYRFSNASVMAFLDALRINPDLPGQAKPAGSR